jgi:hypothetical protein
MSIDTTWHFFNSSHVFSLFFLIICCLLSGYFILVLLFSVSVK